MKEERVLDMTISIKGKTDSKTADEIEKNVLKLMRNSNKANDALKVKRCLKL